MRRCEAPRATTASIAAPCPTPASLTWPSCAAAEFLNGNAVSDWLRRQAPDLKAVSPRYDAAGVSVPILLVHGKVDRRVPVRQSQLMANALKDARKPCTYIEQPLADHFFTRSEDRLEFLKAMKTFLDRYNPADPS